MGILLANVVIAALKDGMGPNMIMVSAVVILLHLLSWERGIRVVFFCWLFVVLVMLLSFLGHLDAFVVYDALRFYPLAYDVLAGALLVAGVALVLDWMALRAGRPVYFRFEQNAVSRLDFFKVVVLLAMIVLVSIVLVVKDLTWAMDPYVVALSNNIFGGLMVKSSFICVGVYSVLKFWMVLAVMIIFSGTFLSRSVKLKVAAAFLLAAGSTLFYVK